MGSTSVYLPINIFRIKENKDNAMASIEISLDEILKIIKNNIEKLPLENAFCEGSYIVGEINPGMLIPNVTVKIQFKRFSGGVMFFDIDANSAIEFILDIIGYSKKGEGYSVDFPTLEVNINEIIESKISGVAIKNVSFRNGEFAIQL